MSQAAIWRPACREVGHDSQIQCRGRRCICFSCDADKLSAGSKRADHAQQASEMMSPTATEASKLYLSVLNM